jgi:hypothetical protein
MLVRPAPSHAAHYGQRIVSRRTSVLPGPGFANAQFRVLAASPVDRENDVTDIIVDIDDDLRN